VLLSQPRSPAPAARLPALQLDVTKSAAAKAAVVTKFERYGKLTVLVNAAGVLRTGHIDSMDEEAWDLLLAVNVTGTFLVTKHAVPALKAAGRGVIVNLSSCRLLSARKMALPIR